MVASFPPSNSHERSTWMRRCLSVDPDSLTSVPSGERRPQLNPGVESCTLSCPGSEFRVEHPQIDEAALFSRSITYFQRPFLREWRTFRLRFSRKAIWLAVIPPDEDSLSPPLCFPTAPRILHALALQSRASRGGKLRLCCLVNPQMITFSV